MPAYQAGNAAYNDHPASRTTGLTADQQAAAIAETYGPPFAVLSNWDSPATTREEALAALRLAEEEAPSGFYVLINMLGAALDYFEREAPACGPTAATDDAAGIGPVLSELLKASEDARTAIDNFDGDDFNDPVLKALCERRCELALAICGYRPLSHAEQRIKVEFLRDWTECNPLTEEEQNALFASMMPEGGEA